MRVLHLVPGNLFGGVETFIAFLARERGLAPDVDQHFALCFEGRLSEAISGTGAPLHLLGAMRTSRPWTVLRGRHELRALLARTHFDVALTHSSWSHAMFAPVLARAGIPIVFYLHGPIDGVVWLDRWAMRVRPTTMIGVSRDTLRTGRLLFPTVAAEVLNYPIPASFALADDARASVRAELGAGADEVVLLQASRADRWKGHDRLLDALGLLRDVPGWTLWMAGGAQRPQERDFLAELKDQVQRLGLAKRVSFLGERRDVPRLLAGADVYCQANVGAEGFSLAFMEASAAGKPIVTTRLGGAPELIDETSGMLVPVGDSAAFAAALRRLIEDGELRLRMGVNARRRVWELCDPAARVRDLERILAQTSSAAHSSFAQAAG